MGFRTYIGKMTKEQYQTIKSLTIKEVSEQFGEGYDDEEPYPPGPYELAKEIYELGKYVELETENFRLFDDDEVDTYFNSDYLFIGLTKKGFTDIINDQRKGISKYYKSLYDGYDILGVDQEPVRSHLRSMSTEWFNDYTNPVDLSDREQITSSWKYEYTIFELIRLYKTFDWDNDIAVIYGY